MKKECAVFAFSPTGTTDQVAGAVAQGLCCPCFDVTEAEKTMCFQKGQLVVFAVPVFSGRVPQVALQRLQALQGGGADAAAVVVYGNRAYEDALLELAQALRQAGFSVLGGAAFVARHSIVPAIASGRPNREDLDAARGFGRSILEKAAKSEKTPVRLPGNQPYRAVNPMAFHPQVQSGCQGCGACAKACPVGAISKENPALTDESRCINCMRCVQLCPNHARALPEKAQDAMAAKLARVCAKVQKNEIYL